MVAEVSTHTFLTMIIEESVCFMSCEPFFLVQLFLCGTHGIYFYLHPTFFSSTEQCAWVIISPKEFCCQIFCDLLLKSAFEHIFNVMQLILVKIKWHSKWKYLIQKFHDICLSYYFKLMYKKYLHKNCFMTKGTVPKSNWKTKQKTF
jgi:hypothetical protein